MIIHVKLVFPLFYLTQEYILHIKFGFLLNYILHFTLFNYGLVLYDKLSQLKAAQLQLIYISLKITLSGQLINIISFFTQCIIVYQKLIHTFLCCFFKIQAIPLLVRCEYIQRFGNIMISLCWVHMKKFYYKTFLNHFSLLIHLQVNQNSKKFLVSNNLKICQNIKTLQILNYDIKGIQISSEFELQFKYKIIFKYLFYYYKVFLKLFIECV
ncbi:hypothetical protein ABPG73_010564 [Tetrahymena malaccensis]